MGSQICVASRIRAHRSHDHSRRSWIKDPGPQIQDTGYTALTRFTPDLGMFSLVATFWIQEKEGKAHTKFSRIIVCMVHIGVMICEHANSGINVK